MKCKIKSWPKLLFSLFITQAAGGIGSIFTTPKIDTWYETLNKPFFQPPNWLFGPVWTLLFLLMGISLYLIWTGSWHHKLKEEALLIFIAQLVLNVFWSIIFFGFQNPSLAFLEILVLWTSILFTILYFVKLNKTAAYLLVPYIFWVSFASVLNFAIWYLN